MAKSKSLFDRLPFDQQQIHMETIISIQMAQSFVLGYQSPFEFFENMGLEELEGIRDTAVKAYNHHLSTLTNP